MRILLKSTVNGVVRASSGTLGGRGSERSLPHLSMKRIAVKVKPLNFLFTLQNRPACISILCELFISGRTLTATCFHMRYSALHTKIDYSQIMT